MTMTRIGIEQYPHTWHIDVGGGTGQTHRERGINCLGGFPEAMTALVELWADVNDREPLAILREVGRVMVQRENELMAKHPRSGPLQVPTYDDLGNERPQPTSGLGSPGFDPLPSAEEAKAANVWHPSHRFEPETGGGLIVKTYPGGSVDSAQVLIQELKPPRSVEFPDRPHRRGPGRPRKEASES